MMRILQRRDCLALCNIISFRVASSFNFLLKKVTFLFIEKVGISFTLQKFDIGMLITVQNIKMIGFTIVFF